MSNTTLEAAHRIHGRDPQSLIEKIIRDRIYLSLYWKEECFALTAEGVLEKAAGLKYFGGVFGGNTKPTNFMCLLLKLLQVQPSDDIVLEFIRNDRFPYVKALGCLYWRLTQKSLAIYTKLEPEYTDYQKLVYKNRSGTLVIVHMDELIDDLLHKDRVCDIIMPAIRKRQVHEELGELEPREPLISDSLTDSNDSEDEEILDIDYSAEKHMALSFKRHKKEIQNEANNEDDKIDKVTPKDSLSIEDTNKLRAKLGLKPLK